ncbi:hypothetical protein EON63_10840 [archaeon]|nr:MAG: hypothetical protein EON63_10840 [archaeon]
MCTCMYVYGIDYVSVHAKCFSTDISCIYCRLRVDADNSVKKSVDPRYNPVIHHTIYHPSYASLAIHY